MRERLGLVAIALLAAAAVGGCGTSESKRAVDARTEVIRFFGVDAPAVAMLDPEPAGRPPELAGLSAWEGIRETIRVRLALAGAGIGSRQLRALVKPHDEIEGIDSADLAIGFPSPGPLLPQRALLVLATDQTDRLNRLLRAVAAQEGVVSAGELHGARLYRSTVTGAYAVRDGVLVSAPYLGEVRAAILRRDGDSDEQLDEDVVDSLLDELRTEGPVVAYTNLGAIIEADPAARELAALTPWMEALGHAAVTAVPRGGSVQVEVRAETDRAALTGEDLPVGSDPTRFTVTTTNVNTLLPGRSGSPDTVRRLLLGVTPVIGEATASTDEIRAQAAVP